MRRLEFITHGLALLPVLFLPGYCLLRLLIKRGWLRVSPAAMVMEAFIFSCLLGYGAAIMHFFNFRRGGLYSYSLFVWALWFLLRDGRKEWRLLRDGWRDPELGPPLKLLVTALFGYGLMLYAGVPGLPWQDVPTQRFSHALPGDTTIPGLFAKYLYEGYRPGVDRMWADWLLSDRPPLQSGLDVYAMDLIVTLFKGNLLLVAQLTGMIAQLLWIPATWSLMHVMRVSRRGMRTFYALALPTAFFFVNDCFIWPKLLAAGLAIHVLTQILTLEEDPEARRPGRYAMIGVAGALAMLSHAGVSFFFIGLAPLVVLSRRRSWLFSKQVVITGATAVVCYLPWLAFQKFVEPPGDRLIKMHLAGVEKVTPGSAWSLIREAYAKMTWQDYLNIRRADLASIFCYVHNFFDLPDAKAAAGLRVNLFFSMVPALETTVIGLCLLPLIVVWRRYRGLPSPRYLWFILSSAVLGVLAWICMMFVPGSTVNHQGSYALNVLFMLIGGIGVGLLPRPLSRLVIAVQWAYFAVLWVILTPELAAPVNPLMNSAGFVLLLAGLLWLPAQVEGEALPQAEAPAASQPGFLRLGSVQD